MRANDIKLEEHFKKAYEEKFEVEIPRDGNENLTPETKGLQKRRKMAKVKTDLALSKVKYDVKMDFIKYKDGVLKCKEQELKKSLFKFEKYLLEHNGKRNKAMKKANEEREARLLKEKESRKMMREIDQLHAESERYDAKLAKNKAFQTYMSRVMDGSEGFNEVRDIMDRYDTLVATQIHLIRKDEHNQDLIAAERARLAKYTEDKEDEILQCSNQIAQLQLRLDEAQSKAVEWETKYSYLQEKADEKRLLLGRLKVAINNLFMLMNRNVRHLQPTTKNQGDQLARPNQAVIQEPRQDTQAKLSRIHVFIKDLDVMIKEHRLEDGHNRREHRKQEEQKKEQKEQKEQQAGK